MKNKDITLNQLEKNVLKHEEILKNKPKFKRIDEIFYVEYIDNGRQTSDSQYP